MRWTIAPVTFVLCLAGCAGQPLPTQPSGLSVMPTRQIEIEAESGSGEGQIRQRSRASGGLTLHLAPGERHQWVFPLNSGPARYAVAVTYANGQEGPNELMTLSLDGTTVRSWINRDSGDAIEGWNLFVTDSAGSLMLSFGTHSLTLETSGGDGCVEIDRLTVTAIDLDTFVGSR
jgi:hypothetical protein